MLENLQFCYYKTVARLFVYTKSVNGLLLKSEQYTITTKIH